MFRGMLGGHVVKRLASTQRTVLGFIRKFASFPYSHISSASDNLE